MEQVRSGSMFMGIGGYDASTLERVTSDDVARQGNRGLIPRFFKETRGRADGTFVEVEMVEILVPGDAKSGPVRMVDDGVKKRFADAYRNWKAGLAENIQGTPIELLVGTGTVMHQYKAMNLHTVEALAEVHDGILDHMGTGGRELRDRARRVLASAKTIREQQDADDKDRRIADLEKALAEMRGIMISPKSTGAAIEAALNPPVPADKVPEGAQPVVGERPPPRVRGKSGGEP